MSFGRAGCVQASSRRASSGDWSALAVSVTHLLAAPEMIALSDDCATVALADLPTPLARHAAEDLAGPADLGT
ncbi:nodulation protein D 1 [Rhizobium grahamii]|uniref:Nodulation protein D 1 n=1 Tax=Rhizobium grahamii CCGE 502 TaxID=990285 RepID=S3HEQ4_9HYPH|nr:nodulation protein D 1 [Rhizobium grahamii]EPE97209.1 nodulation protein D 1 [Rhizobium grahamii CCGE 502]